MERFGGEEKPLAELMVGSVIEAKSAPQQCHRLAGHLGVTHGRQSRSLG
jgi:hypothetical protein